MKTDRNIKHGPNSTYLDTTNFSPDECDGVSELISIVNDGCDITSTNYFDTISGMAGQFFLSGNAGVARLLIPDSMLHAIAEMQTGKFCVLTSGLFLGQPSIEIMFEDHTRAPFAMFISQEQCDFRLQKSKEEFRLAAWTRTGKVGEWRAFQRVGKPLPYRQPWK